MILYRKEHESKCNLKKEESNHTLFIDDDIIFKCKYNTSKKIVKKIPINNLLISKYRYGQHFSKISIEATLDPGCLNGNAIYVKVKGRYTVNKNNIQKEMVINKMLTITKRCLETNSLDRIKNMILGELMERHAKSSNKSMFISFTSSREYCNNQYEGYIFSFEFSDNSGAKPIKNTFVSGNEEEYLVIGNLKRSDVSEIKYCGLTKLNENDISVAIETNIDAKTLGTGQSSGATENCKSGTGQSRGIPGKSDKIKSIRLARKK